MVPAFDTLGVFNAPDVEKAGLGTHMGLLAFNPQCSQGIGLG